MSKPFKSQFDLMAEAYGNVNYNKQRIINEDTAGKTVIGYPPSEDNETGQQAGHSAGDTSVEARNARFHELEMAKALNPKSTEDAEGNDEDYEEPGPQLGGDLDPGEFDYDVEEPIEDAEEAGFNRKQLDELEDIVHAILDKRDHEDRAAKHEDGEH